MGSCGPLSGFFSVRALLLFFAGDGTTCERIMDSALKESHCESIPRRSCPSHLGVSLASPFAVSEVYVHPARRRESPLAIQEGRRRTQERGTETREKKTTDEAEKIEDVEGTSESFAA